MGEDIAQSIALAADIRHGIEDAKRAQETMRRSLAAVFDRVELLTLPTMPAFPPRIDALTPESLFVHCIEITKHVAPFNVAGVPCTAQPVPAPGQPIPASLQLVGPANGEEKLVATAAVIEAAVK